MKKAYIPSVLGSLPTHSALSEGLAVLMGVALLAASAQIVIPLPFTPVPVTGQTFGIALLSLLYGRILGLRSTALYLTAGFVGLPVFAGFSAGAFGGPTMGYLVGMFLSSALIGTLADRGFGQRFLTAWLSCALGSVLVLSCGYLWLKQGLGIERAFELGVLPFLIGDTFKNVTAALVSSRFHQKQKN